MAQKNVHGTAVKYHVQSHRGVPRCSVMHVQNQRVIMLHMQTVRARVMVMLNQAVSLIMRRVIKRLRRLPRRPDIMLMVYPVRRAVGWGMVRILCLKMAILVAMPNVTRFVHVHVRNRRVLQMPRVRMAQPVRRAFNIMGAHAMRPRQHAPCLLNAIMGIT